MHIKHLGEYIHIKYEVNYMENKKKEKTEFLKQISNMDKDELQKMLNKNYKRVKKIYPVVQIKKKNNDS